jgi:hypothetical protein
MHSSKPTYFPCLPTAPSTIAASPATADTCSLGLTARIPMSPTARILFFSVGQRGTPVFYLAHCPRHRSPIIEHYLMAQMTCNAQGNQSCATTAFTLATCDLPPTNMYLFSFATYFPMITKSSIVQLDLDDVNDGTLAINFVVCKPLDYHHLFALPPDAGNKFVYMDIYPNLSTMSTNGINFSIDFLPHFKYVLY